MKDGVSWTEVTNRPAGLDDGDDVGITTETDPTIAASVKDGVDWTEVSNIPADIADGDDVGGLILNKYDSGWFACANGGTYSKTHNLGTTKLLLMLYWASSSGGADMSIVKGALHKGLSDEYSGNVQSITTTQLTVQAGQNGCHMFLDGSGVGSLKSSGYYRVIAIALE